MMHIPEWSRDPLPNHDIVVIGASAGGVEALTYLVAELPRSLRAAVFVVLHVSRGRSVLPEILTRAGDCPRGTLRMGMESRTGKSTWHGLTTISRWKKESSASSMGRPRTATGLPWIRCFGPPHACTARVMGVILTGALDDGTAGLAAVKEAGGVAIVQDPDEAFASSMPRSARAFVTVDHVLPVREIGVLIAGLTNEQTGSRPTVEGPHVRAIETDSARPILRLTAAIGRARSRYLPVPSAMARSGRRMNEA